MTSTALTDDEVKKLLPLLSERVRATTDQDVENFRPPQTGIVEQVSSAWHHFVVGRRGVGKSMLLLTVAAQAEQAKRPLAYIDIETLRDNPYPDVLIRLLMELVGALGSNLGSIRTRGQRRARRRAQRALRELNRRLQTLLRDPQAALHQMSERAEKASRSHARGRFRGAAAGHGALATVDLGIENSASEETQIGRRGRVHQDQTGGSTS